MPPTTTNGPTPDALNSLADSLLSASQPAAPPATDYWGKTKAAMDAVAGAGEHAAAAVGGFAKGVAMSTPPAQAYLAAEGRNDELVGGAKYAVELGKKIYPYETTGQAAMLAGLGGLVEWGAVGKAAKALEFLNAPIVDGFSHIFRRTLGMVSKVPLETADATVGRILTNSTVGGEPLDVEALTSAATKLVRGKAVQTVATHALGGAEIGAAYGAADRQHFGSNVALGALFGAIGGVYGVATNRAILQNAPAFLNQAGPQAEKAIRTLNTLADRISVKEGLQPHESAKMVVRAWLGMATPAQRFAISRALESMPEIVRQPFGVELAQRIRGTQVALPTQFETRARVAQEAAAGRANPASGPPIEGRYQAANEGPPSVTPSMGELVPLKKPDPTYGIPEESVKKMLSALGKSTSGNTVVDGAFPRPLTEAAPQGLPYIIQQHYWPPRFEPVEVSPEAAGLEGYKQPRSSLDVQRIVAGPSSMNGVPVVSETGVHSLLPPMSDPSVDLPNAPNFMVSKLTPNLKKTLDIATRTNDYEGLEKEIGKNQETKARFLHAVLSGALTPEHIRTPNMARSVAGLLEDQREVVREADPSNVARTNQLIETADAFLARSFALRGEQPPEFLAQTQFVREPDSGDIVRTFKSPHPGVVELVDKVGKRALVKAEDVKVPRPQGIPEPDRPVSKLPAHVAAEHLKRVEQAVGNNDNPAIFQRPAIPAGMPRDIGVSPLYTTTAAPSTESRIGQEAYSEGLTTEIKRFNNLYKKMPPAMRASLGNIDPRNPGKIGTLALRDVNNRVEAFLIKHAGEAGALGNKGFTPIRDGTAARVAKQLGGAMYNTDDGRVAVQMGRNTHFFANRGEAEYFVYQMTTANRIVAEQRQVVEKAFPEGPTKDVKDPRSARGRVPFLNIPEVLRAADRLSTFGAVRGENFIDKAFAGVPALNWITEMQKVTLKRLDPESAQNAERYGMLHDMLNRASLDRGAKVAHYLDAHTNGAEIEAGTAAPELQKLYNDVLLPIYNENYELMKKIGVHVKPEVTGKVYFPHTGFAKFENAAAFLDKAKAAGIVGQDAGAQDLTDLINDPDRLPAPDEKAAPKEFQAWKAKQKWLQDAHRALAGTIEKDRRGNEGWDKSIYRSFLKKVHADNRALAQAYVFGPNLERINSAIQRITSNAAFAPKETVLYKEIMNDVLGNGARSYVDSKSGRILSDLTRGLVSGSATRHIFQNSMTLMQFATTPRELLTTVMTPGRALVDYVRNNDHYGFAHSVAASLDMTRWEIGEDPTRFYEESIPEKVAKRVGEGFTFPLHVVINVTRALAANTARYQFDHIFEAAERGDANALAMLQDGLKSKAPVDALKKLDYESLRAMFAKNFSDVVGTTFRAGDFPNIARGKGAAFFRFRTFLNTLPYNILQQLATPGMSMWRRARMAGILIAAIPTLGAIDPLLRRGAKLLGDNIDSKVALDALDRWRKNPTLGRAVYMEIALALNAHLLGYLSDNLQAINIHNETKALALSQFAIPEMSQLLTLEAAATRIGYGIQHGSSKNVRAGLAEGLGVFGGVGTAEARKLGKKGVRLPKSLMFRRVLHAGP